MEKFIEDQLLQSERFLKALEIAKVCDDPGIEHLMSEYKSRLCKFSMLIEKRNRLSLEKEKLLENYRAISSERDELAEQVQEKYQHFINQHPDLIYQFKDGDNQDSVRENIPPSNIGTEVSPCPSEWDKNPLFTPLPPRGHFRNNLVEDVPNPCIKLIDREEMLSVPTYMKGRLTCENVNGFVETLNSVLKKKYSIVSLARKDVKRKDLIQYSNWKSQEEEYSLQGKTYFTAEDLVSLGNTKMDKVADKIIQVLRHLKRLRQSQVSGKVVLYILLQPQF